MKILKNTLIAASMALTTLAATAQDFTPRLIIKNETGKTITFRASREVVEQLKAKQSTQLSTTEFFDVHDGKIIRMELGNITLNPDETLTLDSVPTSLESRTTLLLHPDKYDALRIEDHVLAGNLAVNHMKPLVKSVDLHIAIQFKKDIVIHLTLDKVYRDGSHMLDVSNIELVDHTA